jgi:hypothetical protein
MKTAMMACALSSLALYAAPATAHHSGAAFDFAKTATLTGVVKEFDVLNPHTHAALLVGDGKARHEVKFEGHSVSNFYRSGWRRGSVKAGDTITITYAPMRNGTEGGFITGFTTAAGQRVGFENFSATGAPKAR